MNILKKSQPLPNVYTHWIYSRFVYTLNSNNLKCKNNSQRIGSPPLAGSVDTSFYAYNVEKADRRY